MLVDIQRNGRTSGDCDEAALLGATLAAAIGFRPQAVVIGFAPTPGAAFRHIYTELPLDPFDQQWLDLNVTRPADLPPVPVTRVMRFKLY